MAVSSELKYSFQEEGGGSWEVGGIQRVTSGRTESWKILQGSTSAMKREQSTPEEKTDQSSDVGCPTLYVLLLLVGK